MSAFSVEHLVQDGGSGDGTVEWLERNAEKLKTETLKGNGEREVGYEFHWVSEPDAGQTAAINRGLARATGEILAYLCADDYYTPGALGAVAEVFQSHPEADFVYGDYAFLEGDSGWVRGKRAGPWSVARLEAHNFLAQPSVFWRRRVYEKFGGFDEGLRYCMDHEYWLRVRKDTVWHYLPRRLAVQRLHGDAKTSRALVAMWEETAGMAARYGMGEHFRRKARHMRRWGARYYAWKRRVFRVAGRWLK